ncbi:MAG: hypothetical protein NC307_14470 [Roseburia sp.]|nr:hypothetical protein [Roseburia sp.]
MEKRTRRKTEKVLPLLMATVLAISFTGCGSTANPTGGKDVAESTESMSASDVADMLEDGATVDEIIDKVEEIKDGNTPSTDKPAGTASPTAEPSATGKPESTAEPTATPTAKPQATATPEPTAPPHVHEYAESITKQPTCAEAGVKTLTCSCGEVKTEAIAATGHDFVTQYKTIEHDALGHVEVTEQQVQVGTTRRTEYECAYCGARFDSAEAKMEHCKATGDFNHAFCSTYALDYDDPVYETQTTQTWVIDSPAWSENVPNGSICSKCNMVGP